MSETGIDYQRRIQNALRGVVRDVLKDAEANGLPGDHHFYIAFKTQYPGVQVPAGQLARFPDEMTIVLQHKFWGLKVHEDHFEVGLSFNRQPEQLRIPFAALIGFHDPTVQFALQFQDDTADNEGDDERDTEAAYADAQDAALLAAAEVEAEESARESAAPDAAAKEDGAKVVALDAFRKK